MSASEMPEALAGPDEFWRRRRGAAQQTSAEEALVVDMARRLAPVRPSTPDSPLAPRETQAKRRLLGLASGEERGTASIGEQPKTPGFRPLSWRNPVNVEPPREPGSVWWLNKASALAPAGAALAGAVLVIATFGPRWGGVPSQPKAPTLAAVQGPAAMAPTAGEADEPSRDAGLTALKDAIRAARAKPALSEAETIQAGAPPSSSNLAPREGSAAAPDLPPQASSATAPPDAAEPTAAAAAEAPLPAAVAPAPASAPPSEAAEPTAAAAAEAPLRAAVAPVAPPPAPAPPPVTSQVPDSNAGRTASQPLEAPPEGGRAASSAVSGQAAHASQARPLPARAAPRTQAVAVSPASTPKLDLPAKPWRRSAARSPVVKAEETAPAAPAETRTRLLRRRGSTTSQAPTQPQAAPPAEAEQTVKTANPLAQAFGAITGAAGAPAADQADPSSHDWAVQFAAPKSEADAKIDAARLNAKYAPALKGATIGVQKAEVNGETTYALRVPALSKAEAAALCERLRGRDCSLVK